MKTMNNLNRNTDRAGIREWMGLAVLTLPVLILAMDMTVLYMALPHITQDLNPSSIQSLWIVDIYGFMVAGFLMMMGNLCDRVGHRKMLVFGAISFCIASLLAAYSNSTEMLIATRAFLGVAGAALMPSTLSLIGHMFKLERQRGIAIGIWMSSFAVGTIIGPMAGGIMLEFFWWGSVFLLAVPVTILLLVSAPFLLPEYRGALTVRLDLPSVILSLAFIMALIFGIKNIAQSGLNALPLVSIVVGLLLGLIFVLRQRRLPNPLMDLQLFRQRPFSTALAVLLLCNLAIGGVYLFATQFLQLVLELSPLQAGLWLLPSAFAVICGSMLAPNLAQKMNPGFVVGSGLLVSVVGFLFLNGVKTEAGLPLLITSLVISFLGVGMVQSLGVNLVVGSAPAEKSGTASALSEMSTELGMALGVAVLGSVGSAVMGSTNMLNATHDSFTFGLHVVGATSAAITFGIAVITFAVFRYKH
ncbi:hypothetical protein CHH75_15390 [Paenibacillus sp. 7541]|uniref:Major facilitator superfamily (MFS) profile domain-containing protein n=2 Tax=Paenibacillus TaxID=44249 RepID=A0A268EHS0_9BACL|nr:hypothetical protein CHH67_21670 [Paenibacillus campinasensis]PAK51110.1 hypothetical protein CHH75_15390 [Paenibacillus sp. 7541]